MIRTEPGGKGRPGSRRGWHIAGWVAAAVAAVVLVGVASGLYAVQSWINPEQIKRQLVAAVERSTGRTLRIDGPVRLSLLPRPQISAQGISLANMPGASPQAMIRVSSAEAQIAVLPLLSHQVSLERVTLYAPDMLLERDAGGRWNWQFEPREMPHTGAAMGKPSSERGEGSVAWALSLQHLRIQGGSLTVLRHRANGTTESESVKLRDLHADSVSGSAPSLRLRATHDGAPFTLEARSGPLARVLQSWPMQDWPLRLMLMQDNGGTDDGVIRAVGTLSGGASRRAFGFDVHAAEPELASLNDLFPHAGLPSMQAVALSATLRGTLGPLGAGKPVVHVLALHLQAGASDLTRLVHGLVLSSLAVDAASPQVPVALTLNGTINGQASVLKGSFGTLPSLEAAGVDLMAGSAGALAPDLGRRLARGDGVPLLPLDLTLRSAPAQLDLHGALGGGQSHLQLHASVPDLQAIRPQAPHLTHASLDAALSADQGVRFGLQELHFTSDEAALEGEARLDIAKRPKLTARLHAQQLDLDALRERQILLGTGTGTGTGTPTRPASPRGAAVPADGSTGRDAWFDRKVPFDLLASADGDVSLSIDHLRLQGDGYDALVAHAVLDDGVLTLDPFALHAPQGALSGRLVFRSPSSATPAQVALALHAPAVPLAAVVPAAVSSWRDARGDMQVEADLNADGETPRAWAASLGGTLGLSLVDGAVPNAALASIADSLGLTGGVHVAPGGVSALRCAATAIRFEHGVGHVDPLVLDSSRLRLHGSGAVDLGARRLDLHLVPTVLLGGAGVATPVKVEGWPGALHAAMDAGMPGGRFGLVIAGGDAPDACPAALVAARFGQPGPQPAAQPPPQKHGGKAMDILRGLGLVH